MGEEGWRDGGTEGCRDGGREVCLMRIGNVRRAGRVDGGVAWWVGLKLGWLLYVCMYVWQVGNKEK